MMFRYSVPSFANHRPLRELSRRAFRPFAPNGSGYYSYPSDNSTTATMPRCLPAYAAYLLSIWH